MRDDEFLWEPYGPAMVMRTRAAISGGRVVDYAYEVFSNTHSTRPGQTTDAANNLLASWSLGSHNDRRRPPTFHSRLAAGTATRSRSTHLQASGSSTTS